MHYIMRISIESGQVWKSIYVYLQINIAGLVLCPEQKSLLLAHAVNTLWARFESPVNLNPKVQ